MALQLTLRIDAEASPAVAAINRVVDAVRPVASRISAAFKPAFDDLSRITGFLKGGVNFFAQVGLAIQGVEATVGRAVSAIQNFVAAAAESERVQQRLAFALSSAGAGTDANVSKFAALANELQRISGVSDEAVMQVEAMLLQVGVAPDKLDAATRATLDLAQATGTDMTTAARMLGMTLNGQLNPRLALMVPELRELTEEQRKAGDGIALVAEKYKGAAEVMGLTVEGSINKVRESFGNLQERIGTLITQSPAFIAALEIIQESLDLLMQSPEDFQETLGSTISFLINAASAVKAAWDFIIGAVRASFFEFMSFIMTVAEKVMWLGNKVGAVSDTTYDSVAAMAKAAQEGYNENVEASADALNRFGAAVQGKSELAIAFEERARSVTERMEANKQRMREFSELRARADAAATAAVTEGAADAGAAAVENAEDRKRAAMKQTADAAMEAANTVASAMQQEAALVSRGFQLVGGGAFGSTLVNPQTGEVETVAAATGAPVGAAAGGGGGRGASIINVQAGTVFGGGVAAMRDSALDVAGAQASVARVSGPRAYFWT